MSPRASGLNDLKCVQIQIWPTDSPTWARGQGGTWLSVIARRRLVLCGPNIAGRTTPDATGMGP